MNRQVRSDEARRNLRDLLDEVALGARITILRYDKPAAMLVPLDRLTDGDRDLIARAREVGGRLRRRDAALDREAGWLMKEMAERLGGPDPDEESSS